MSGSADVFLRHFANFVVASGKASTGKDHRQLEPTFSFKAHNRFHSAAALFWQLINSCDHTMLHPPAASIASCYWLVAQPATFLAIVERGQC